MRRPSEIVRANPGFADIRDYADLPIPGDVYSCLVELGIEVHRVSGDEVIGLCPGHVKRTGHPDSHPSWSVLAEDRVSDDGSRVPAGTHNCFSCGYRGTFVGLVADVQGASWDDARAWVRQRGGILRAKRVLSRLERPQGPQDTTKNLNEASLALFTDPPAWALSQRLLDLNSARHYGVLWNPEGPQNGSWILPIRDPDRHTLWGWQEKNERWFRNRPRDVTKSKTLFGYGQHDSDTAIILESPLDCVRLHSVGIAGGLSSFGVAVSDEQMSLVRNVAEVVILALDADRDGESYSKAILNRWSGRGLSLRVLDYTHTSAKDIGEMTSDEIKYAVANSVPRIVARF